MTSFTFVDLFAGIGGFHWACAALGGRCLAACELDPLAQLLYKKHFDIVPHNDIRTMPTVQGVDLVCAGFPCQPYSTAGRRMGLRDQRGQLVHALMDFIDRSKPKAFLLENVKGLMTLQRGSTFKRIVKDLEALGYEVAWQVLDSRFFGLPQHRERVYIVGRRHNHARLPSSPLPFHIPQTRMPPSLEAFLDPVKTVQEDTSLLCDIFKGISLWDPPKATPVGFMLRAQRSPFTNRKLFSSHGIVGTIATGMSPPIYDERLGIARHLNQNELKRCQGFPVRSMTFPKDASRSLVLQYVGNAVSVPVVKAVVRQLVSNGWLR